MATVVVSKVRLPNKDIGHAPFWRKQKYDQFFFYALKDKKENIGMITF